MDGGGRTASSTGAKHAWAWCAGSGSCVASKPSKFVPLTEISFIGIRTLCGQITRGYCDHSPLTRPKEEVTHGGRCRRGRDKVVFSSAFHTNVTSGSNVSQINTSGRCFSDVSFPRFLNPFCVLCGFLCFCRNVSVSTRGPPAVYAGLLLVFLGCFYFRAREHACRSETRTALRAGLNSQCPFRLLAAGAAPAHATQTSCRRT